MKLKVGNYARTKNKIIKINQIIENGIREFEDDYGRIFEEETGKKVIRYSDKDGWNCGVDEDGIIKSSENIIDLIEAGDYVNGYRVYSGGENHFDYILTWDEESDYYMKIELPSVDIKSIVTKDQFDSMKYEVE